MASFHSIRILGRMIKGWLYLIGFFMVIVVSPFECYSAEEENEPGFPLLALWLETPLEVPAGETVLLKLRIRNISARLVTLNLGRPAQDFIITKLDGTEVWRWLHGKIIQMILMLKSLNSGEELEFEAEWKQVDNNGNTVPPGTYLARGILRGGVLDTEGPDLKTEPKELVILP